MPTYIYTAKSSPQDTRQGEIEAESQQGVINKLNQMGFFPVSVQLKDEHQNKRTEIFCLQKVSRKDVVLFTRQLSSLIDAGVDVIRGLNILYKQSTNKYLKIVLSDVMGKIKDGQPLSIALSSYPRIFPKLYTSMIHSGEVSGSLSATLRRLADFLEKEQGFKNAIRSALVYPAFVLSVGILTVITLLIFVIPRLVNMFSDMGQVLPLPTKILISLSSLARNGWWFFLALIFAIVFLSRRFLQSLQGRVFWDRLKLKLGLLGPIVLKTEVSRLSRILSLLLSAGIPIVTSLEIAMSIVGNSILKAQIQEFKEEIISGASLSKCLKKSSFFPEFMANIVAIGEETGTLEKSLLRIADDYEREVDDFLKAFSRLLEPLIILFVGLIVGFMVLAMLLPIFQINLIVK